MEFSVIPGQIQMERFILGKIFGKKVIPFEVFPFSRFYRNSRKFLYNLSPLTNASLLAVMLPKKNAKISKMAADFQNVYRYNVCLCSSVVLADVLEHNCKPVGENELRFVVGESHK